MLVANASNFVRLSSMGGRSAGCHVDDARGERVGNAVVGRDAECQPAGDPVAWLRRGRQRCRPSCARQSAGARTARWRQTCGRSTRGPPRLGRSSPPGKQRDPRSYSIVTVASSSQRRPPQRSADRSGWDRQKSRMTDVPGPFTSGVASMITIALFSATLREARGRVVAWPIARKMPPSGVTTLEHHHHGLA